MISNVTENIVFGSNYENSLVDVFVLCIPLRPHYVSSVPNGLLATQDMISPSKPSIRSTTT